MRDDVYEHYLSEIDRFYNDQVFYYNHHQTNEPKDYIRFHQMYRYAEPICKQTENHKKYYAGIILHTDSPDIKYDDPTEDVYETTVMNGIHGFEGTTKFGETIGVTSPSPYDSMKEWFENYSKKEHIRQLFNEEIRKLGF